MSVVIIHGSNSKEQEKLAKGGLQQNKRNWIPWIKEKLEEKEIECFTPLMPESWAPNYLKWKKEFEKITVDEESILVGTSAGGAFLVKWLGETGRKVEKLILVAPAILHGEVEDNVLREFYGFDINGDISEKIRRIVIISSSNDSEGIKQAEKIYSKALGIKPLVLENKGHFT